MGQSREKLLGLTGWMSGNLVLGGEVVGVGAYYLFLPLRWAIIRGGRLFEGGEGAYSRWALI